MSILRIVAATIVGAAIVVMQVTTHAAAHNGATYFPERWVDRSQTWHMTDEVPSGDGHRQRIVDAAAAWSDGDLVTWTRGNDSPGNFDPLDSCNESHGNAVFFRDIDGPGKVLGLTSSCVYVSDNSLAQAQIVIDASEAWHTDSAPPEQPILNVGDTICVDLKDRVCKFDLQSVATHEFGHATGFSGPYENGHFDPNAALCSEDNEQRETMCPWIDIFDSAGRTLEDHELHTYERAY